MTAGLRTVSMWRHWPYLAVALLAATLTLPTIGYDFVQDDRVLVLENPSLGGWSGVIDALTKDYFYRHGYAGGVGYYRPLTRLSLAADYAVWGTWPTGYHLTNVLLGVLTVLLAHRFFARVVSTSVAALAAVFFACHPVRAQSVGMVTARSDLIATTFALLAAREWIRGRDHARPVACVLLFLAFCGKESALALVLILAAWSLGGTEGTPDRRRPSTWCCLLVPVAGYAGLRMILNVTAPPLPVSDPLTLLTEAGRVLGFYLRALLFPLDLPAAPLLPVTHHAWPLILLVLPIAALVPWHRRLGLSIRLSLTWLTFSLVPLLLPSAISHPKVDGYLAPSPRFLLIPSAGVALLWVGALDRARRRFPAPHAALLAGSVWAIILSAELLSGLRWLANDRLIAEVILRDRERIPEAHQSDQYRADLLAYRAKLLSDIGEFDRSEQAFRELLRLNPDVLNGQIGLGILYHLTGRDSLAIAHLRSELAPERISRWDTDDCFRHYVVGVTLLARWLLALGQGEEALWWAEQARSLFPTSWKAHRLVAEIRLARGDTTGAENSVMAAMNLAPRGAPRMELDSMRRAITLSNMEPVR